MPDKLKQFVDENREELELYQPREHLWDGIDARLNRHRSGVRWQRLAIAASVILVLTCGTWAFIASQQDRRDETIVQAQPQAPLQEAEVYFTAIVKMKDAELNKYCSPHPELCREFEQDIEHLNEAYHQLKREYANSGDRQAILQAMAFNLQMQVQLINRQLQIMETVQQKKDAFETI